MSAVAWSVVVPTYQRPGALARCVSALARLVPPPGGFEVLIVNDGGQEPDAGLLQVLAREGVPAKIVSQANAGPAAARNRGAELASGQWLAFTDDDCEPEPRWLVELDCALHTTPGALAGGRIVNALADNLYAEASHSLATFVSQWFDGAMSERFFTTNNLAVDRAAFSDVGAFDTAFAAAAGEDREFCDRWSAAGRPSVVVEMAVVRHFHRSSLPSFLRQHFGYGRGARRFRKVRAETGRPVHIQPGFYVASLRHAARGRDPLRGIAVAGLIALAHAVYLAGLTREAIASAFHRAG